MAERKAAEDEFNPRHRIVGAVILVALAVIFLPMLLNDQPPPPAPAAPGAMPSPETRVVVTPVPLPGERTAAPDRTATAPDTLTPPRTVADIVDQPATPAAPATPPAEPKPVQPSVASSKPAAAVTGKWVVQVGVFAQPDNARRLQGRLRQKGYSAKLDPPVPGKGQTVRVEVGPYPDQAAARAAATRIQRDFDIKGVVRSD